MILKVATPFSVYFVIIYVDIIVLIPSNQPQPDIKVACFGIHIKFCRFRRGIGIQLTEEPKSIQIGELRQLHQAVREIIDFPTEFISQRFFVAGVPGRPPFVSVIIGAGVEYLTDRNR